MKTDGMDPLPPTMPPSLLDAAARARAHLIDRIFGTQ
jgi:hypothetical protein